MRGSQRLDVVLGGTLLVTGLLEVAADRVGFRPIPAVIAVLVGSAAMLLRSTRPVLCLAVFVTVAVVTQIPGIAEALTASVAVGCLLALGNVGAAILRSDQYHCGHSNNRYLHARHGLRLASVGCGGGGAWMRYCLGSRPAHAP